MRLILALILAASPASAETWSSSTSTVEIRETVMGAELLFENGRADATADHEATLSAGEVTVQIVVKLGRGAAPDTLTVETPEGWVAIPRSLTLEDGSDGTVQVVPLDLDMM